MRSARSRAVLLTFVLGACARPEPPPRAPVVWTDGKGKPVRDPGRSSESIRYRQEHPYTPSGPTPVHHDQTTPRPRCNDGTHAAHCSPGNLERDCCAAQGGLHRDPWGTVVFE